ncbi:hypothetical protein LTR86_004629 [Recurvomyces mirabilis]|nr:hypothetical protein LTR86_004629 [Recurvomyces mirabilis]
MVKGRQTVRLPQQHRKNEEISKKATIDATKEVGPRDPLSPQNIQSVLIQILPLLTLAALTSPVSQATLSPVYGSIPSSINHTEAITATLLLGFIARHLWRDWIGDVSIQPYLTLWAFWVPFAEMFLFKYSDSWGPILGAIITGLIGCHVLLVGTGYAVAQVIEGMELQSTMGVVGGVAIPALVLDFAVFRPLEFGLARLVPMLWMWSGFFTPPKLLYIIAGGFGLASRPKPYWLLSLSIPSILLAFFANPQFDASPRDLELVNEGVAAVNWTVLDRSWSNTGYLSVVENTELNYRALRCDHSLLGGEWLLTSERRGKEGWLVSEPIYAVFSMLEAVRLIDVPTPVPDGSANALVIGLGIGTAPKAFITHGINTTIVELDPKVLEFATKYFGLPTDHTSVIQDAVSWVEIQATATTSDSTQKYDYILHDVFTGGAEPLALFTATFLTSLRSLLTSEGVIAINYAGDLNLPLTSSILTTIQRTFNGQCKIYRDAPPEPENKDKKSAEGDFLNMVVFCRNSASGGEITFRKPVKKDFLGSRSKEHYLLPKAEWEIPFPSSISKRDDGKGGKALEVLEKGSQGKWRKQQEESALRHWYIMRRVLPAKVWEMW